MRARSGALGPGLDEPVHAAGSAPPKAGAALTVQGLSVAYRRDGTLTQVVNAVDLSLRAGQIRGLVGESGCGKSTLALGAIGYRSPTTVILAGRSLVAGRDLLGLGQRDLRKIWGREVAYLAQNAATALNPALTIKTHFRDVLARHMALDGKESSSRALEMLDAVGLPEPAPALKRYPHEFSGGQQQRVALALALSCRPSVLILDEPTTGLDVTTQAQISKLLIGLVQGLGIAALYVTHDIALLATLATEISVMYGGEIVESGLTEELAAAPEHPYTRALLAAIPTMSGTRRVSGIPGEPPTEVSPDACSFVPRCKFAAAECSEQRPAPISITETHVARCIRLHAVRSHLHATAAPELERVKSPVGSNLLAIDNLFCHYGHGERSVTAVDGVSLALGGSEAVGIVGLSGSGKSTLLRAVVGLHSRMSGSIAFRGEPLAHEARLRPSSLRRDIQIVFQDPGSSLNPRHRVGDLIRRPIKLFRSDLGADERSALVHELMERVRLPRRLIDRYPAELSGGQQQRVAIARAFSAGPALLLCDEVTSSLDVSVQAAIIELVRELAEASGTAILFVSHDLAVVRSVADRTIVMLHGSICEEAPTDELFENPKHEYTIRLMSAIPDLSDARPKPSAG